MATKYDFHSVVIGRSEVLTFVNEELELIPAKVDTGAYRSSVHASNIKLHKDGTLSFKLFGGHPRFGGLARDITVKKFNKVGIRNSFGHRQDRYEVKFKVKLGSKIFFAHFTLADRSKNVYPILLGRTMLNHRFIVDTSKSHVRRAGLKKLYDIDFPGDEEEGRDE